MKSTTVIALAGKGGVGKTSISAPPSKMDDAMLGWKEETQKTSSANRQSWFSF